MWAFAIFIAGFSLRLFLLLKVEPLTGHTPVGEINQIAHSLAFTGRYADAYGPGSGLTAHDMPLYPLLLACMVRIFGEGAAGEIAVRVLTALGASLAYALLPYLSELCLFGRLSGIVAGFVGALLPLTLWPFIAATNQPIAAALLVVQAILFCILLQPGRSKWWSAIAGIFAAVACLLSAQFLTVLAFSAVAAFFLAPKRALLIRPFLAIAACVILALAPWALRNRAALGHMIWTRSDFGIEFAQSNNDWASPVFDVLVHSPKWRHPLYAPEEKQKVILVGEYAYNQALLKTARAWVQAHPAKFLLMTGERAILFWFPIRKRLVQTVIGDLEALIGIVGLIVLFIRRHPSAWLFGGILAGYSWIFLLVATGPRYSYPIDPLLLLLGAFFVCHRTAPREGLVNQPAPAGEHVTSAQSA